MYQAPLSQDINLARPTEEDPGSFEESEDEGDGHKDQLREDDDAAIAGVEAWRLLEYSCKNVEACPRNQTNKNLGSTLYRRTITWLLTRIHCRTKKITNTLVV